MGTYSKSPLLEAGSVSAGSGCVAAAFASEPFVAAVAGFFFRFLPPREPRRVFFFGFGAAASDSASAVTG
jgi:hypothetical protein